MNWLNILGAIAALSLMGFLFGALLSVASKIFHVDTDERFPLILEALPGANCGGCGYSGCSNYASEIIAGHAPLNACTVGGQASVDKISEIMGVESQVTEKYVAHVFCSGGNNTQKKFNYQGMEDCVAALRVGNGDLECKYGCLGLGTCAKACPFDAIRVVNGVAVVEADKCMACKKCVAACPRHLISVIPYSADVCVSCSSKDPGAVLRKICNIGCIACKLCEKACQYGAITVNENLAKIDYAKCVNCGECVKACPRKLIKDASNITSDVVKKL